MFEAGDIPAGERERMARASSWFRELQGRICDRFAELEALKRGEGSPVRPEFAETRRRSGQGDDGGGGFMARFRNGAVFEKAGINFSEVYGVLDPASCQSLTSRKGLELDADDGRFWASGLSLVCHMQNPHVPAVHLNTRMFWTPVASWFGGGTDLNPCIEYEEDTRQFHAVLEACCNRHDPAYYPEFSRWADRYFRIRHRGRARGVGGVFLDDLDTGSWDDDFAFIRELGEAFIDAWLPIVERRQDTAWSDDERETQLIHRGHYVEFNLIYDRGTRFGLETGHDPDAVLMSLPPLARWP